MNNMVQKEADVMSAYYKLQKQIEVLMNTYDISYNCAVMDKVHLCIAEYCDAEIAFHREAEREGTDV